MSPFYGTSTQHWGCHDISAAPWENQQSAYAKTKTQNSFAVTAKLISAFVFATRIVQSLYFLNTKFHASSCFLCLYSPVCVGPVRKPHCWFSHEAAHLFALNIITQGLLHAWFDKNHWPHHVVSLSKTLTPYSSG